RLVCYTLGSVVERSILSLGLPSHIEGRLFSRGITELWFPQAEAVEKGLFLGNNIAYSTGTASGKSLLAYLLAANASISEKVIYIVPTRTLAFEAFKMMKDLIHSPQTPVAISTRERCEYDDGLSDYAIITLTYEKFYSLVKQGKINESTIRCLIADEVHFISNRERGIPLEFTLTRMKIEQESTDPQIVALSAMVSGNDAKQLSSWLHASLVRRDWKPVELDEMILYDDKLYHKNGTIDEVSPPIRLSSADSKFSQRMTIAVRLVRDILIKGGQCMVVVRSRRDAERIAEGISKYLDASRFFDPDSRERLSLRDVEREKLRKEIQRSEPELSFCARKLVRYINNGVAYHHAGLPARYREIIERGVREQLVSVLVTTTTFEVGVNLPISSVIFLDLSRGTRTMPISTYRNLAGRAGRPEFDVSGESIIISLTEEELKKLRDLYLLSEEEPLESSIQYFMRRQPVARYAIQSQILEMASQRDTIDVHSLIDFMKQSWFWVRADESTRERFVKHIDTELWKLGVFGYVERSGDSITITRPGRAAGNTMLSPFSIRNLLDNAQRILKGDYDKESIVILLLSLVGIPHEVGDNDEIIRRVRVPSKFEFISRVLEQDKALKEPEERIQLCPQYATVLWYWINSLPTDEILQTCGLDPSADAALLEELLPNDAYWVLNTLASIPDSALKMSAEQRILIRKLATDCKFGSSEENSHTLLSMGLQHIGRNTAIKIAKYLCEEKRDLQNLKESAIVELFPGNKESARLLFAEIQEKQRDRCDS
ncbi:MAG: DEAD/DEAH box helicase, partial [Candidatus Bathyarchaeota archaeon]|nr:DEAD/DEAH box helicase [Candidatus Bathyarchaeota archaeon]